MAGLVDIVMVSVNFRLLKNRGMGAKLIAIVFSLTALSSSGGSLCAGPSSSANSEASPAEIRSLLQVNGVADIGQAVGSVVAQQFTAGVRHANPNLPARADNVISDFVVDYIRKAAARDQFAEKLVPIYARYLTKEDVLHLVEFYKSPTGRKLVSVTPAMSLESGSLGQQWVQSILPGLQTALLEHLRGEKLIE